MIDFKKEKQNIYLKGIKWDVEINKSHFLTEYIILKIRDIECIQLIPRWNGIDYKILEEGLFTKEIDIEKSVNFSKFIMRTINELVKKYYSTFKKIDELYKKHDSYSFAHLIKFRIYFVDDLEMKLKWLEFLNSFSDEIFLIVRLYNLEFITISDFLLWKKFQTIERKVINEKYKVNILEASHIHLEIDSRIDSYKFDLTNLKYIRWYKRKEGTFSNPAELTEFFLNLQF